MTRLSRLSLFTPSAITLLHKGCNSRLSMFALCQFAFEQIHFTLTVPRPLPFLIEASMQGLKLSVVFLTSRTAETKRSKDAE